MTVAEMRACAERIASSIPEHRKPLLLLLRAKNSKTAIHRKVRELVRQSVREILSPEHEGRIAVMLTQILGLNKRRRYRKHAKLGDK